MQSRIRIRIRIMEFYKYEIEILVSVAWPCLMMDESLHDLNLLLQLLVITD